MTKLKSSQMKGQINDGEVVIKKNAEEFEGKPLSDVALSGDYDDLINKPENLSDFNDDIGIGGGANVGSYLSDSKYIAGEDIKKGDVLFVESFTDFTDTEEQIIGDDADRTRIAIPFFGNGKTGKEFKMGVRKEASPTANLIFEIQTDDNGKPSGDLFDPNAKARITPDDLTTSLIDTTIQLDDDITIPRGQKVRLVIYAGLGGVEVVNAINYYAVSITNKITNIRKTLFYNGIKYEYIGDLKTESHGIDTEYIQNRSKVGFLIKAKNSLVIESITKRTSSTATHIYIEKEDGTILEQGTFNGDIYTLNNPLYLGKNQQIKILADSNGGLYSLRFNSTASNYPRIGTDLEFHEGGTIYRGGNIQSIQFKLIGENGCGTYLNGNFIENEVLSKASALYTYTLPDYPMIAMENKDVGEVVTYAFDGIVDVFSGLEYGEIYKYSNIPGEIEKSTTNSNLIVGKAINENTLLIGDNIIRPVEDITFFAKSWVNTGAFDYTITIGDLEKGYYLISGNGNSSGAGSPRSRIYIKLNGNQIIHGDIDGVVHYYTAYLKEGDVLNFTGDGGSIGSFAYIRGGYRKNKPKFNYS